MNQNDEDKMNFNFSTHPQEMPAEPLNRFQDPRSEEGAGLEPHPITLLPFVRDTTAAERLAGMPQRIFWDVKPTGEIVEDSATGRRYGRQALEFMTRNNFPGLLGWVVFDMMRCGPEYSGIEIDFLGVFSRHAVAAARILEMNSEAMGPIRPSN